MLAIKNTFQYETPYITSEQGGIFRLLYENLQEGCKIDQK